MSKRLLLGLWSPALAAWAGVVYLLIEIEVGAVADPIHPSRLLYYALCIAAPLLTFEPIGRIVGLRFYGAEATVFWAGLLTLFTFVSPNNLAVSAYLLFMLLLFGAASAVFLPIGYAAGFKLLTLKIHKHDVGRARREGYLAGLFIVLSAAMNLGGFYSLMNGLLLFVILVLAESFALSHKPGLEPAGADVATSPLELG
ncbi:MAG: hypothetical protein WKH64_17550 [Chloroflexia bacterium]